MSILKTYIVPHPPLIIPSIGRGKEKKIQTTINAYKQVAKEVSTIKPDTIIIISPHSVNYQDSIHISPGAYAEGDFNNFYSPETIKVEYDELLINEIDKIAKEKKYPINIDTENNPKLDHGTMIPLYFINQEYQNYKVIRIGISNLSLEKHYQFGIIIKEAIQNKNNKTIVIASGDLSHKLQENGPYGYSEDGKKYEKMIIKTLMNANFKELINYNQELLEKAAICGHPSFSIMAGTLDKTKVKSKFYSHEDITGVGYTIISYTPMSEDIYVQLATKTIEEYIKNNKILKINNDIPKELIDNKAGVFVTIYKNNYLRGCIGTIFPTSNSIAEEIINNAISSATKDNRFIPIEKEELEDLTIKVDVLSKPEIINSIEELNPKEYGIIITRGYKRGVLLPDIEGVNTKEEQIAIAKEKGNITENDYIIERFTVKRHI